MSDQPPLRIVNYEDGESLSSASSAGAAGDQRALNTSDKTCLALLIAVLLLAPLCAGMFATPSGVSFGAGDVLSQLQVVGVSLLDVLIAVALGVAVWREWRRPVAIGAIAGLAGATLLLAAWSGLSLLTHTPLAASGLNAWTSLLAALTMGGLVSRLGRDPKALLGLLLVVVCAGSLAGAIGVREYLEHWRQGEANHRVFGSFNDPNFLAGYLLLTLPLALGCFAASRERLTRLLLGLGLFLQTACLLLTGSRAGAGMLAVVIAAWLLLLSRAGILRPNLKPVCAGLGLMLVASLLASAPLLVRLAGSRNASPPVQSPRPPNNTSAGGTANMPGGNGTPAASVGGAEYSGKFRQYTWIGTLRMAQANPVAGTGIGSYETAYPRYATTAFTIHAHNSLLQWTAETGFLGVIFLLAILAASTAFGTYILFLHNPRSRKPNTKTTDRDKTHATMQPSDTEVPSKPLLLFSPSPSLNPSPWNFAEPRLLLAGLLAAVLSTTLHSLFDSDWYIVATALTLGATLGLLSAQSRDLAPLATQTPRPLSRAMLAGCAVIALLLVWRGGMTLVSRWREAQAQQATTLFQEQAARGEMAASASLQEALEGYRAAASLDPLNPELLLTLGSLYQSSGQSEQARQALEQAVAIAPTGKSLYLLGQLHRRQGIATAGGQQATHGALDDPLALSGIAADAKNAQADTANARQAEWKQALDAFGRARDRDPHNLQTLRALAETDALSGSPAESVLVYRDMAALETTPLGTVRAVPERVETDFAFAHARLASYLMSQHDLNAALAEYRKADDLLKTYWQRRHYDVYEFLSVEKKRPLNALYDATLTGWQTALKAQQAATPVQSSAIAQTLAQVEAEQAAFHQEMQADREAAEEAARKAQAEQNATGNVAP